MSIAADHSAMVSIINAETDAQRVYYYDPISSRGSKHFAFNAVRLRSPSRYMLDSGPFTVYAEGQFLGEGLAEPILPGGVAFIPYALDRNIVVDPEVTGREQIDELLTIERGVVSTESRKIRTTKLTLVNRGSKPARVFVRHQVAPGYKLVKAPSLKIVKLGGAHLVEVTVPATGSLAIGIEEWTPIKKSIDIRTDRGVKAIGLYLRNAHIGPELAQSLRDIVTRHRKAADLEQRIELLGQQIGVYRTRVSELNVQLFTLKRVPQAARLRVHLAQKMDEISDKLQDATMEISDLRAQLMTMRIDLEDKLAELTLKPAPKTDAAATAPSAPKE